MKRIFLLSALLCFVWLAGIQIMPAKGVQILLKGKVIDEITGSPVSAQLEFRSPDGRKFKNQTNSITGMFEQVGNAGETFEILVTNYDIVRKLEKVTIKDTIKYTEQELIIYVKKLTPGNKIYQLNAFEGNNNTINQNVMKVLDEVKSIIQFNRGVKFNIVINSHDVYSKKAITEIPEQPKKSRKKAPKPAPIVKYIEPEPEGVKQLVDSRTDAVKKAIEAIKLFKDKVFVVGDYSSLNPPESGSFLQIPDFLIVVKELKNALELD